jgi:hypothetical protein
MTELAESSKKDYDSKRFVLLMVMVIKILEFCIHFLWMIRGTFTLCYIIISSTYLSSVFFTLGSLTRLL